MNLPKFGLIYKNYLFYHDIYKYIQVKKNEEGLKLSINQTYRYLELSYNTVEDLKQVSFLTILKDGDELPAGLYELYPIYYFNDVPCIVSRLLRENLFCMYYVDGLDKNYVKKVDTTKKVGANVIGDISYVFAFKGDYIPYQDEISGKIIQKADSKELVDWLIDTGMIYPFSDNWPKVNYNFLKLDSRKYNFFSGNEKVYRRQELGDVYADGSTYAMQVIDTLQRAYPEIHFFATPSDWGKKNNYKDVSPNNQRTYDEWMRYTVMQEDFTQARREFFPAFGPVSLNTRLKIEFEYACLDTIKFRQRRADFFIDQFLSYYNHDHISLDADIVGDNSNIIGFSILWNKEEALFGEQQKGTSILDSAELDVHKINFNCELVFVVLRYSQSFPPILKGMLSIIDTDDKHRLQDYYIEHETTQAQKEYIMREFNRGRFLKQGDIYLLDNDELVLSTEQSEKEDNVKVVHPDYKRDHEIDTELDDTPTIPLNSIEISPYYIETLKLYSKTLIKINKDEYEVLSNNDEIVETTKEEKQFTIFCKKPGQCQLTISSGNESIKVNIKIDNPSETILKANIESLTMRVNDSFPVIIETNSDSYTYTLENDFGNCIKIQNGIRLQVFEKGETNLIITAKTLDLPEKTLTIPIRIL